MGLRKATEIMHPTNCKCKGRDIDCILDGEFRMAISHILLGYQDSIVKNDFDKMIQICVDITKKYMSPIEFPDDYDEIMTEAERQGFVFNEGKWRQSGYGDKSSLEMYLDIKKYHKIGGKNA